MSEWRTLLHNGDRPQTGTQTAHSTTKQSFFCFFATETNENKRMVAILAKCCHQWASIWEMNGEREGIQENRRVSLVNFSVKSLIFALKVNSFEAIIRLVKRKEMPLFSRMPSITKEN